jgi:hypothetical protein
VLEIMSRCVVMEEGFSDGGEWGEVSYLFLVVLPLYFQEMRCLISLLIASHKSTGSRVLVDCGMTPALAHGSAKRA